MLIKFEEPTKPTREYLMRTIIGMSPSYYVVIFENHLEIMRLYAGSVLEATTLKLQYEALGYEVKLW